MIPYKLSRDYNKLFNLICDKKRIVGFVDYDFNRDEKIICRDICTIQRHGEYEIQISARGICYCSVDPWHKEDWVDLTEKEVFGKICEAINLEFIFPLNKKDQKCQSL